jgi:hypothetical protein
VTGNGLAIGLKDANVGETGAAIALGAANTRKGLAAALIGAFVEEKGVSLGVNAFVEETRDRKPENHGTLINWKF